MSQRKRKHNKKDRKKREKEEENDNKKENEEVVEKHLVKIWQQHTASNLKNVQIPIFSCCVSFLAL